MAKPLGMMDAAYFTGRGEIIGWLNATFGMRVERIEEAANGAILCQILDAVFPGVVAMGKVDWAARSPHEMVNNYKVAQAAMNGRVDRHLDVEKLVRAKPQDSLELMQWAKSFFERSYDSTPYDARGRRARGKNADAVPSFATGGAAAAAAAPPAGAGSSAIGRPGAAGRVGATPAAAARTRAAAAPGATAGAAAAPLGARTPGAPLAGGAAAGSARPLPLVGRSRPPSPQHAAPANGGVGGASAAALQRKVDELSAEAADLRLSVSSLERERDFYFGKLRSLEVILQGYAGPDPALARRLLGEMYHSDDPDFVSPSVDDAAGAGI